MTFSLAMEILLILKAFNGINSEKFKDVVIDYLEKNKLGEKKSIIN